MCVVLPTFLDVYSLYDGGTLYVHVAGKMICNNFRENLSSKYDINCAPDMKIRNLTIKFVSRYSNMTYRYYMQQPRSMEVSRMVKHMSHEEKMSCVERHYCKGKAI